MVEWVEHHGSSGGGTLTRRGAMLGAAFALFAEARAQTVGAPISLGLLCGEAGRFQPILDAICKGIEVTLAGVRIVRRDLPAASAPSDLRAWIASGPDAFVVLGSEAWAASRLLLGGKPAVAALLYPDFVAGARIGAVSLDFDPEPMFREIKLLLPQTERVQVVFLERRDEWIVARAREVGTNFGVSVVAHAAKNISEATDHCSGVLRYGDPGRDALWMLGGAGLVSRDTSAHLLQTAFNAKFPVISNRRALVEEGALLGGEPNFERYGGQIANAVVQALAGKATAQLVASLRPVLNVRVARRIGVDVNEGVRRRMASLVGDE